MNSFFLFFVFLYSWAGGFRRFNPGIEPGATLVVGTNQGIHARVRKHPSSLIVTSTTSDGSRLGPFAIPMRKADLLAAAREGSFFSYAAGVAYKILTDYHVSGLEIENYASDLPIEKGLSSSGKRGREKTKKLTAACFFSCFEKLSKTNG